MLLGTGNDLLYGHIADATCRVVDDPAEGLLVIRVGNQSEICDDVFDFLSLIEGKPADDLVGNPLLAELILERTALYIRAVEDSEVVVIAGVTVSDAFQFSSNSHRFLPVAVAGLVEYLVTCGFL